MRLKLNGKMDVNVGQQEKVSKDGFRQKEQLMGPRRNPGEREENKYEEQKQNLCSRNPR